MSGYKDVGKPLSPFRSRPVQFVLSPINNYSVPTMTEKMRDNNNNKRRASVPVAYLFGSNKNETTNTSSAHKKARHSTVAASSHSATSRIMTKSPYEHDFCAESNEPLFDRVANILASLTELEMYKEKNDSEVVIVKLAIQRLHPHGKATSDEFLDVVVNAHQTLAKTDEIWDEGWTQPGAFGREQFQPILIMPDYLLLLMIRPNRIAGATSQEELAGIFTHRGHLFKEAVAKLDGKQQFKSLHYTTGKAERNPTELKTMLFVIRVYLAMKLCGYERLEDVPCSPGASTGTINTLQQKVIECMQLLHASTLSSPLSMRARPTATVTSAVPKRTLEDVLSLPLDTSDEDDDYDDESERQNNVPADIIPETSAENLSLSYQSVVDFLQTQQAKQFSVERQVRRYHEQNVQQSQLIMELHKTVQQCQSKMRDYKSINAGLVAELASVQQEHSQAQAALLEEVEILRREKEQLLNEKKTLKDFVNKL